MTDLVPDFVQPHGAPHQKQRVLDYLREHPEGLTQLVALQVLAVSRLAAIVFRLKDDDGYNITTSLVDMETRYGTAKVARYHLGKPEQFHKGGPVGQRTPTSLVGEAGIEETRMVSFQCPTCCDLGVVRLNQGTRNDTAPCPAIGCKSRKEAAPTVTPADVARLRQELFE